MLSTGNGLVASFRFVLLTAALLFAPAAVGAVPIALYEADFMLSESALPPPDSAAWTKQTLPDEWRYTRPQTSGTAWYRFRIPLPEAPAEVQALYVPRGGDRLAVFVNGTMIDSTAEAGGKAMNTWKKPLLFAVPPNALVAGENRVDIRLQGWSGHQSGLSPLQFGAQEALRAAYWKRYALQTVGPVSIATALGLLGIFFLALWSRRREDVTYALFGAASLVWAGRNVLDVLFHLVIAQPHWEILMAAMYLVFVWLLCLFCLRFVGATLPRYEKLLRWTVPAAPLVLYASQPWMSVLDSSHFAMLFALALVVPPMLTVAREALLRRNSGAVLIALTGIASFGFGVYDWIAAGSQDLFGSVRLVPYAALFFMTAAGWLLLHRFIAAYAQLERMNAELDNRVALKSAELMSNLAKLEKAKAEAEEANRAKSRFLAAASHDLRQPLHALGLFAANLGMKVRAPETQEVVAKINQSVEALEELFSELLDISRLDAGTVTLRRRCFPVQEVFDRLAVSYLPLAQEKGLLLRIRPTSEWVDSDPLMFERILRNLLSNAIRYTERGGILVACRRRRKRLWLQVWDTGLGIAETEREKIFEEFYQVDNPGRDRRKGLGLGLAIVRRQVELLGEQLMLRSEPGRGSMFAMRARRALPALQQREEAPAAASFAQGERLVALLEDDALVRQAMEGLLARQGLAVASGAALAEARDALLRLGRKPDLIIADFCLLGGESGLQAAQQLRSEFGAHIPVLLLTGESAEGELALAGANGFPVLRKPVGGNRLIERIRLLLAEGEAVA